MRIEIIATRLSETDQGTQQHYAATKGDVLTVPDGFGKHLCDQGWAKDADGKYANAPFTPTNGARVAPVPLTVKHGKGKK